MATYNGWANYETWNVMLWMDNEEHAYRCYRALVASARKMKHRFTGDDAKEACKQAFDSGTPDGVSFDSAKILWGAIARAMREE